jgi:hypothetical protein
MSADSLLVAPIVLSVPADLNRIRETVTYYTGGKVFAAVFPNGSCVFPLKGSKVVQNSCEQLRNLPRNADFEVREMDDSNFVVKFNEYIFGIVFRDEFNSLREAVSQEIRESQASETVLGKAGVSADHFLIGVVARTRLFHDADNPVPVVLIEPK